MAGASAAGAASALLIVLLLWAFGAFPGSADPANVLAPRLAAIENQLRDLAARPAAPSVDPKAVADLSARLDKAETALAAPRPPAADPAIPGRLAAIENTMKSLTGGVAALGGRMDDAIAAARDARGRADATAAALDDLKSAAQAATADRNEIEKLATRTAALERTDRAVADELGKRAASAASDRAVRLAVAASVLRTAVERGDPFGTELATVKALSPNAGALAALEPFAASGVPGAAALANELLALMPAVRKAASAAPQDGGFLERLQANAERLVRVRPVNEPAGDDVSAVLTRIEVKAAHGDVPGALGELVRLSPPVRAPAEGWIARAEARTKAVALNRRIAAEAITGLQTAP